MKMLVAGEGFIIVEKNETLDIVYSPYSNKVLAISKEGTLILREIVRYCKESKGRIEKIYNDYNKEDVDYLLDILVENKMLFLSREEMEKADYSLHYKENNMFFIHKAYLHLTQKCNLKCQYCYNASNLGKTEDMSTQEWKNIILKLKKEGFDYIVFTGGEVFLRKDLIELTGYVKQLDMTLHILTNGTFQIPEYILEKADKVEISLDSINESINEEKRVNSKNYKVYKNILQIPPTMRKKIVIKTVLSKTNCDSILKTKKELQKNGFMDNEIILQQPNSEKEVDIYPEKILPREKHRFDAKMTSKCNGCYEIIAVNADGNIYPCQALIKKELVLANISDENWKEKIKNHNLTRMFMEDDITTSECKECPFRYICGGPCKAVSYNTTKSLLNGRGDYCKRAKKEAIEYIKSIDFGDQG